MKHHILKAVSLEFSPFINFDKEDDKIIPKDSLDQRMFSTIAEKMNFKVFLLFLLFIMLNEIMVIHV